MELQFTLLTSAKGEPSKNLTANKQAIPPPLAFHLLDTITANLTVLCGVCYRIDNVLNNNKSTNQKAGLDNLHYFKQQIYGK